MLVFINISLEQKAQLRMTQWCRHMLGTSGQLHAPTALFVGKQNRGTQGIRYCVGPSVDLDALDKTDNTVPNIGDWTQTIRMSKPQVMRFYCSEAAWIVWLLFCNMLERTVTVVHDTTEPGWQKVNYRLAMCSHIALIHSNLKKKSMLLLHNCSAVLSYSIRISAWNAGILLLKSCHFTVLPAKGFPDILLPWVSIIRLSGSSNTQKYSPESWSAAARLEGEVLSPGGGCLSTARGTRPSGGESTDEPEVDMRTRHQSGAEVFSSKTSTCCPLWTLSSWLPAAATWSAITHVISTTGACKEQ